MTTMQIMFWVGILVIFALPAIIALVISRFHQGIADMIFGWYGGITGDLCFSNNARATGFFILALLLTISAFIGGFGKPLLDDSVDSMVTGVKNWESKKLPMPKEGSLLWGVLTRDGEIKITPPAPVEITASIEAKDSTEKITLTKATTKNKHYASWWWWLVAFGSWIFAIVYLPLSRRNEVFELIGDMWNRYSTIKGDATIAGDQETASGSGTSAVAGATTAIASVASAAGGYRIWKDIFGNGVYDLFKSLFAKKRS